MASKKRGKSKQGGRDPDELDEMSDDMTQRGEASGLGDDENPGEGEGVDEEVEVAEIEGELIPEGRESIETEAEEVGEEQAEERPSTSGTGRGKQGTGGGRRQRRASKPRAKAKSASKPSGGKKRR